MPTDRSGASGGGDAGSGGGAAVAVGAERGGEAVRADADVLVGGDQIEGHGREIEDRNGTEN